ncbi:MAG: ABC transporter ATP-binding protein [Planctomycetota bacterium]
MLRVKNLNKFYGVHHVLKNLSFEVHPNEILGFLGPNGAGKTTTLQILTGYASAYSGLVEIGGYDIVRSAQQARAQIGYLPESVPLYPDQTPEEYLNFRAKIKGVPYRDRAFFIQDVLEKCELKEVLEKRIGTLSKGYRQRVGLADALLAKPPILILDEPTEGLDPLQKKALGELILQLKNDHTILFSTHILPEAAHICSKVLILHQGKRLALDTPERLLQHLHQGWKRYSAVIKGKESQITSKLEALEGIEKVTWIAGEKYHYQIFCQPETDPRESIFQTCVKNQWTLLELALNHESLEDIFIHLVQQTQEAVH